MFAGIMKNNHLSIERLFDSNLCGDKYRAAFSRSRFDDRKTREARRAETKFVPISKIWNILIKNCKENDDPSAYITIDVQL
ncbi:hypothetical protein J437_LFUL002132, partial [Ladona fulva]